MRCLPQSRKSIQRPVASELDRAPVARRPSSSQTLVANKNSPRYAHRRVVRDRNAVHGDIRAISAKAPAPAHGLQHQPEGRVAALGIHRKRSAAIVPRADGCPAQCGSDCAAIAAHPGTARAERERELRKVSRLGADSRSAFAPAAANALRKHAVPPVSKRADARAISEGDGCVSPVPSSPARAANAQAERGSDFRREGEHLRGKFAEPFGIGCSGVVGRGVGTTRAAESAAASNTLHQHAGGIAADSEDAPIERGGSAACVSPVGSAYT